MKNLFTNLVLFFALIIALSSFTACTNTASTQKGPIDENAPPTENTEVAKKINFPPVPSGILQTEIKDLEGNTFKLEDKKGKVVLVNLWATWCGPCRAEMPELVAMQEKYKDKDFEVLGLNADNESAEDIKAFAEQMKLNYPLGYAANRLKTEFIRVTKMGGIPQSILINREGQMTGVFTGGGNRIISQIKESVEKAVNE
jgi:thiol-disulfide isomerase/thioredoxin